MNFVVLNQSYETLNITTMLNIDIPKLVETCCQAALSIGWSPFGILEEVLAMIEKDPLEREKIRIEFQDQFQKIRHTYPF